MAVVSYPAKYSVARDVVAGCFDCWGSDGHWHGANAQGVAARHHYATGHQTWADVSLSVIYGDKLVRQEVMLTTMPKKRKRKHK
jgi:hypothetical protein